MVAAINARVGGVIGANGSCCARLWSGMTFGASWTTEA
jgi:hypothetical protein